MMVRIPLFFLLLTACQSALASAQAVPGVEHHTGAQLLELVSGAATAPNRMSGRLLGNRESYTYILVRRDRTSEVELHDAWDDLMFIQAGSAVVLYGGTLTGGSEAAPGEVRGGSLEGAARVTVSAGDVLLLPAGVPHQVVVDDGGSITYVIVKAQPATAPR